MKDRNFDKPYGVWEMSTMSWEESDLDYNNAMGLALFCSENDTLSAIDFNAAARNFAVIACSEPDVWGTVEPIWHEMAWHGGFQGYDWLYQHCITIGAITESGNDGDDDDGATSIYP